MPPVAPDSATLAVVLVTAFWSGLSSAFGEEPARRRLAGFVMVAEVALWMMHEPTARYDVTAFEKLHSTMLLYDVRPRPRRLTATFRRVLG